MSEQKVVQLFRVVDNFGRGPVAVLSTSAVEHIGNYRAMSSAITYHQQVIDKEEMGLFALTKAEAIERYIARQQRFVEQGKRSQQLIVEAQNL